MRSPRQTTFRKIIFRCHHLALLKLTLSLLLFLVIVVVVVVEYCYWMLLLLLLLLLLILLLLVGCRKVELVYQGGEETNSHHKGSKIYQQNWTQWTSRCISAFQMWISFAPYHIWILWESTICWCLWKASIIVRPAANMYKKPAGSGVTWRSDNFQFQNPTPVEIRMNKIWNELGLNLNPTTFLSRKETKEEIGFYWWFQNFCPFLIQDPIQDPIGGN